VKVDQQIKEIKNLEKQRNRLIARMQVIEDLQKSRPKLVKVFDSLPRIVPEGVELSTVNRVGDLITFNGKAESNGRISVFMREIDSNTEYSESKLKIIKKTALKSDFSISVKERKQQKDSEGE
jgi:type IV pilus assembly protein PilN